MTSFDEECETPEMETLASLAEKLVYRLPGCSDLMIRKTLQDVYRDFCRRSCCLCGRRHFVISADNPDIVVSPIFGGLVESISDVRYNGRVLGQRDYTIIGNRIELRESLIPYEGCDESQYPKVDVMVVEIPKLDSEDVSKWFLDQYGEMVCSGVLSKLMTMTGRPWTDAAQGQMERMVYENAVTEARCRYYGQNRSGDLGCAVSNNELL